MKDFLIAFSKALYDHLIQKKYQFTTTKYGAGGCETCGYGASEYEVVDWSDLQDEIHEFTKKYDCTD